MIVLRRPPRGPERFSLPCVLTAPAWPHRHPDGRHVNTPVNRWCSQCAVELMLADLQREWITADPAGMAWWRWRTGQPAAAPDRSDGRARC